MRRIFRTVALVLMCGIFAMPQVEAAERTPRESTSRAAGRPSAGRPAGTTAGRPGTATTPARPGSTATPARPGTSGTPTAPTRPGNTGHTRPTIPGTPTAPTRPGNTGPTRPTNPGHTAGTPTAPGRPTAPGYRPPRPNVMPPAPRPYRPVMPAYSRPMPPRAWRPYAGCPTINGILGLAFGTAFHMSLDYLYGAGYQVSGYGNNVVYLTDINAFNYMWPDASLYYGNGGLSYSQFYYSSPYYDINRYNSVFAGLVSTYGSPVSSTQTPQGGVVSTWFGYNNAYITLSFGPGTAQGGGIRYFTTLTFGN